MIMMPYGCPWPSLQLTGHADLWHPTGFGALMLSRGAGGLAALLLAAVRRELRVGLLAADDRPLRTSPEPEPPVGNR
jgi:hypothetical protein